MNYSTMTVMMCCMASALLSFATRLGPSPWGYLFFAGGYGMLIWAVIRIVRMIWKMVRR